MTDGEKIAATTSFHTNRGELAREIDRLVESRVSERTRQLETQKDGAYAERDRLVAALSKMYPSSLERHPDSDASWDNDWRWIVFVNLPSGQATWHIHDSELHWFDHLPRFTGQVWDGHTTSQKYERLEQL